MRHTTLRYVSLLFIIGLLVYVADLNNALVLDDLQLIINNTYIHTLSGSNITHWFTDNSFAGAGKLSDYYRPLLLASFALNYAVDGVTPFGYHLVNNLIHLFNALLVFWLMLFAFKKHWIAFFVALVFLVHPMQSDGVAYVAGRGDLLASLFMLGGLLLWLKGVASLRRVPYQILSVGALVLALLSRENAIVFPFLAAVFYLAFVSKERFLRSLTDAFVLLWPHLLTVAGYFVLRLTVLNFRNFLNFGNYDSTSLYAQNVFVRLYTFAHVLLEYLRSFFLPTNIHLRFTFPITESFFSWPVVVCTFALVLLAVYLVVLYRARDQHYRVWLFASGWFFVALAPASGLIAGNVIIQDHRLYLAMIGISALGIYYLDKSVAYGEAHGHQWLRVAVTGALVCYLIFFSWVTVERAILWGKPTELFEETVRYEPNATLAYNALGALYLNQGEYDTAQNYLLLATTKPYYSPLPYYNLGYLYQHRSKPDIASAILYYKKTLEIDPQSWRAHQRLAEIYMEQGSPEALVQLDRLNELRPHDPDIYYNLARMHHFFGEESDALAWAEMGRELVRDNDAATALFMSLITEITSQQSDGR